MREGRRRRLVGLAGLVGAVLFVVVGLQQVSWQMTVMAAFLGLMSIAVVTARDPVLEAWSAGMEGSWLGVILGLVAACVMWVIAVTTGGFGPYGIALVMTLTALGRARTVILRPVDGGPPKRD